MPKSGEMTVAQQIGSIVKLDQTRPRALQVQPSRKLMKIWEWGDLALIRSRVGADLEKSIPSAISQAQARLTPATPPEFEQMLKPALSLCAPSGMQAGERAEWIKASIMMLADMPCDLLAIGCHAAMSKCDHPSKVVPTIIAAVEGRWRDRKRELYDFQRLAEAASLPAPGEA